ncbi:MAG: DNA mismatch repair endonuclease MutL, partial [Bacillota bacterium]|nr:DNA mismatch repair endonuclease MutL [Bacillota bacterium]
ISDLVGKIMIANPEIGFELENNGKIVFRSNGNGKMRDAIMSVYGRDTVKHLLPLESETFRGYICHPSFHKPNRSYYHFYINHRYIQNDILNRTLEEAYRTLMPERRFPVAFIDITASPSDYDINVHPNKLEVKFNKGSEISQKLFDELKKVLATTERSYEMSSPIGKFESPKPREIPGEESPSPRPIIHQMKPDKFADGGRQMGFSDIKIASSIQEEKTLLPSEETLRMTEPLEQSTGNLQTADHDTPLKQKLRSDFKKISDAVDMSLLQKIEESSNDKENVNVEDTGGTITDKTVEELLSVNLFQSGEGLSLQEQFDAFEKSQKLDLDESFYSSLEILGQLAASFIVAAGSDALYIIDQHAAHERLLYNKIRKSFSKENNDAQPLLVPIEINLNHKQYGWVIENIIGIRDLGFVLEEFGDQCFIIREVPTWAKDVDYVAFLLELADGFIEEGSPLTVENIKDSRIMTRACKSAIKANRYLTKSDIHYLFTELDMAEDAFTCPHGRPITIKYDVSEIRRKFLRT